MVKKMEKHNTILKEFLDIVPLKNKNLYQELTNSAIDLGYVPTRDKTKCISISFRNNKTKFTIMKFAEETKDGFKFKFAANKNYSKIFDESIKHCNKVLRDKFSEKLKENMSCFGCIKC
jgi:hypothetical protein